MEINSGREKGREKEKRGTKRKSGREKEERGTERVRLGKEKWERE